MKVEHGDPQGRRFIVEAGEGSGMNTEKLDAIEIDLALWRAYVQHDANPTELEMWGAVRTAVDVVPDLLAAARRCAELRAENAKLRAVIEEHARHHEDCMRHPDSGRSQSTPCDCGLDEDLAALAP